VPGFRLKPLIPSCKCSCAAVGRHPEKPDHGRLSPLSSLAFPQRRRPALWRRRPTSEDFSARNSNPGIMGLRPPLIYDRHGNFFKNLSRWSQQQAPGMGRPQNFSHKNCLDPFRCDFLFSQGRIKGSYAQPDILSAYPINFHFRVFFCENQVFPTHKS
jgi:hypothetical protein